MSLSKVLAVWERVIIEKFNIQRYWKHCVCTPLGGLKLCNSQKSAPTLVFLLVAAYNEQDYMTF
jgi:hypothetical protein